MEVIVSASHINNSTVVGDTNLAVPMIPPPPNCFSPFNHLSWHLISIFIHLFLLLLFLNLTMFPMIQGLIHGPLLLFTLATRDYLRMLDSVLHAGVCLLTNTFRSSPTPVLLVDAGILPLHTCCQSSIIKSQYCIYHLPDSFPCMSSLKGCMLSLNMLALVSQSLFITGLGPPWQSLMLPTSQFVPINSTP